MVQATQNQQGPVGVYPFGYSGAAWRDRDDSRDMVENPRLVRMLHFAIWGVLAIPIGAFWLLADGEPPPLKVSSAMLWPEHGSYGTVVNATYQVEVGRDIGPKAGCQATVTRKLVDAAGRGWPMGTTDLGYAKGANTIEFSMVVPRNAEPGAGTLTAQMDWSCNWVEQRLGKSLELPALPFQVSRVLPP